MLFSLGFVSLFITGGLTGPVLAQPILDEYLHNTFFVVAHFHLIMAMAGVFGLFAATYYWFPLLTASAGRSRPPAIRTPRPLALLAHASSEPTPSSCPCTSPASPANPATTPS